jgi:hypothetical protein
VEGERPGGLDEIVNLVLGTGRGLTIIVVLTNIDNLKEPALNTQTSVRIGRVLLFAVSIATLAWAFGVVVFGSGVSQLLAWWSRVAIIHDAGGIRFSTAFEFDPLTVTIGLTLTLTLVALAFRVGEGLQQDSEGLI